jgi:hypothetical protein
MFRPNSSRRGAALAVAGAALALAAGLPRGAIAEGNSFDERLRRAAAAQDARNRAEEEEYRRLAAAAAARREAAEKEHDAELRRRERDFRAMIAQQREEEAAWRRATEAHAQATAGQLGQGVAAARTELSAREAESERAFLQKRMEFSRELKARRDEQLARAEALRQRNATGEKTRNRPASASGASPAGRPGPAAPRQGPPASQPAATGSPPAAAKPMAATPRPHARVYDAPAGPLPASACVPQPDEDSNVLFRAVDPVVGRLFGPCCGISNRCDHLPLACFGADQNGACGRHDHVLANRCRRGWRELGDGCVRAAHRRLAAESDSFPFRVLFGILGAEPGRRDPDFPPPGSPGKMY